MTCDKVIEKSILELCEKDDESISISEGRKGLNLNIVKNRLIPHQYFHFLML
jgi:hypothetical protein